MDWEQLAVNNITKLCNAADRYALTCPQLAAYYMGQVEKTKTILDKPRTPAHIACQFCGTVFRPENHTSHLEPKMKLNCKARKLLIKQQAGIPVGTFQAKLLKTYLSSKNRLEILCLTCFKKSVIYGQGRIEKARKPSETPVSTSNRDSAGLSKAAKKKLRRKQKQQQERQNDSGLDLSIGSSLLSTSRSSMGSSNHNRSLSLSSIDSLAISDSIPKHTSTPIPENNKVKKTPAFSTPVHPMNSHLANQLASILNFNSTVEVAHTPNITNNNNNNKSNSANKTSSKKDKKGVLHRLLAKEKKEKETLQRSSTLASFLSSVN